MEDKDKAILDELPQSVKVHLYEDFMYQDFVKVFKRRFSIFIPDSPRKHSYFTWDIDIFVDFMVDILV